MAERRSPISISDFQNPFMEDLLAELTIDILSRLPVKTIFHCKCVCKKWRNLLLESSFVRLHLSRSPTGLIINHQHPYHTGILEWLEIENKDDYHHLHHDPLMSLRLNLAPILRKSLLKLKGSVNGLICLLQNRLNIYICNLVTREYMILPTQKYARKYGEIIGYGFGVSSMTGEYKVIRTFKSCKNQSEVEVYTLGTGQWRSLGRVPYQFHQSIFSDGSFLNDHYHWIVSDKEEKLCSFDLGKETFQLFPSPPLEEAIQGSKYHYESLAILKGCLCKMDFYKSQFTIWVMKEYGIKESWHKELVITQTFSLHWPIGKETLYLIEGLKDGSILMLREGTMCAFYPNNKTIEDIGLFRFSSCLGALAYRPSFVRLHNFELERVYMF